ncbi:leucine-rich repeat-containing protein 20 isoform X3 [Antechinus flavipes]|uniref:leucine-rich repeat-containing protein 20 isoform X3 n=1 Tax=Antechinus flavipes TaxID=38775 RepID=UPI0022366BE5|nr:leucine-rich repeat-containing protein 20 isoform X3 [Antechinus flavipes]
MVDEHLWRQGPGDAEVPASPSRTTRWRRFSDRKDWVCMLKKMGEAVARVARKVNETVENDSDTLDLAECKLVSFPVGIYKVLRNVAEHIRFIVLANNELQALTGKFMSTFSQLQDVPVEKLAAMPALRSVNLQLNPLNPEVRAIARPLIKFDLLVSPEGAQSDSAP